MSSRRNSLGRGLGALLPGSSSGFSEPHVSTEEGLAVPPEKIDSAETRATPEISIDLIDPNPEQPRRRFEAAELEKLVRSIQRHGVLQPH